MNRQTHTLVAAGLLAAVTAPAAMATDTTPPAPPPAFGAGHHGHRITDLRGVPAVTPIERQSLANDTYRTGLWTANHLQVTLMSIPPGGDVGLEVHPDTDQFFRVEAGQGQVQVGDDTKLSFVKDVTVDDVMLVPQGKWHNVVNTGKTPLKMYVLYGPAHHPAGTVHQTKADDPHSGDPRPNPAVDPATPVSALGGDPGAVPFVTNIKEATRANMAFRTALWTGSHLQLTAMDVPVGGEVGREMHSNVDQFLRVESGRAKVYFGKSADDLRLSHVAKAGDAILVPAGTWHNIVNDSPKNPVELYSIYGPPNHPRGTVHPTKPTE